MKEMNFLIVPLDDDDSDDEEDPPEPVDPTGTEESRLTTEGDIPDAVIGQIFIKTLTGKTIAMSDITTGTLIIDIKRFLEGKEGIPTTNQRLKYDGKKVKDYHTVGYYNIQRESELHMTGRLRGGGKRAASGAGKNKATKEEINDKLRNDVDVYLLQLKTCNQHPVASVVHSHLQTFNQSMNVDQIKHLINNSFSLEQARELQQVINTTNNDTTRIRPLMNFIFGSDIQSINEDLRLMDVCKSAIVASTHLCFSINYLADNGCYDWKKYAQDLQDAIDIKVDARAIAQASAAQREAINRAVAEALERERSSRSNVDVSMV